MNNGGHQHNPTAPAQMWDEQQDIDQESQQSNQQGWQKQNQQGQQVAGRMRRAMEMSGSRETQTDQGKQRSDGMNDENRGQRASRTRWQIKLVIVGILDFIWRVNMPL